MGPTNLDAVQQQAFDWLLACLAKEDVPGHEDVNSYPETSLRVTHLGVTLELLAEQNSIQFDLLIEELCRDHPEVAKTGVANLRTLLDFFGLDPE